MKIEIDMYDVETMQLVIELLQKRIDRHLAEMREKEAAEERFRSSINRPADILGLGQIRGMFQE